MLKSIQLRDFFSFKGEKTVKLKKGVNLLLGINGSGKTSFINSLRLLSEGVAGDGLMKLIQEQWGGYNQIVNCNGERTVPCVQITYIFDYKGLNKLNPTVGFQSDVYYRITIRKSGTSYSLNETVYTQNRKNPDKNFNYLEFNNGKGKISIRHEDGKVEFQNYDSDDVSGQELVIRQINDPVRYLPTYVLRKAIETIAVYEDFDVSEKSNLRKPSDFSSDIRLRKSGENLTHVLNKLKLDYSFDFERLEDKFHNVNQNFKSIEINNLYGKAYLSFRENNLSRAIGALHISGGTLRYLLLESIFYNPLRGNFVAIDEPESGLHPDMIKSVADMIKLAAKNTQIIIATHSPHLLNQFELDDILVFEKNPDNSTIVHSISESDYPDWEGDYLPGQMWLLGQIGGKRW